MKPSRFGLSTLSRLAFTAMFLAGCDHAGNPVRDPAPDPGSEPTQQTPAAVDGVVRSGQFLDSAVMGLAYSTPTQQGYTDRQGRFEYLDGETVTFFLGNPSAAEGHAWKLGETAASEILTPLELVHTDTLDQKVRNTLRLLQSLDIDRDATNGIELSLESMESPDSSLLLDLTLSDSEFQNDPVIQDYMERVTASGELIPAQAAVDHFQATLNELLDFPLGKWIFTHGTIDGTPIEGLSAFMEIESESRYQAQYQRTGDSGSLSASFRLEGMKVDSDADNYHLTVAEESILANTDGSDLFEVLSALPEETREFIDVALAVQARLRVLPNSIVLESDDAGVVLNYARSDSTGDDVIAYLQINPVNVELGESGEQMQLDAVAHAASSAVVFPTVFSWSSSDPAVVSVDNDGQITAVSNGSAIIRVTAAGLQASIDVEVTIATATPVDNGEFVSNEDQTPAPGQQERCPDGFVQTQNNRESVTQENISIGNVDELEQTNQQEIVQENSELVCIPVTTDVVETPDSGF